MRPLLGFMLTLLCAQSARADGIFEMPCEPRAAFVTRLQSLLSAPEHADANLARFHVSVRQSGPQTWDTSIALTERPDELRSLRDATCATAAQAAALLLAAWIDSLPTSTTTFSAPHKEPTRVGLSLFVDGGLSLFNPVQLGSLGTSLSVLVLDSKRSFGQIGLRAWPGPLRLASDGGMTLWELMFSAGGWFAHFGPFDAGMYASISVGALPSASNATTSRFEIGPALRVALTPALFVRYQLCLSISKEPVRASLTSALGLDWAIFDL